MQGIESLIEKDLEKTRKQNIAENKAFLAKILADISANGLSIPKKGRASNPKPRRSATPRINREEVVGRRPVTRQRRRQIIKDGDEGEEDPLSAPPSPPDENNNLRVRLPFKRKRACPEPKATEEGSPKKIKVDMDEVQLDEISYKCSEKIYDTYNGTTCHQCRQKTIDQKTICKSEACLGVRGQFCGVCLKNRYGEDAREALLNENWTCPPCRGICNCSICRNREGFCATGILIHVALQRGFPDVNSYLQSLQSDGDSEDDEDKDEDAEENEEEEEGKKVEKERIEGMVKLGEIKFVVKQEKMDEEEEDQMEEEVEEGKKSQEEDKNVEEEKEVKKEMKVLKVKLEKLTGVKLKEKARTVKMSEDREVEPKVLKVKLERLTEVELKEKVKMVEDKEVEQKGNEDKENKDDNEMKVEKPDENEMKVEKPARRGRKPGRGRKRN